MPLDASAVAMLLHEFGQRTALRGGNPYRARAYSRAAENLLALTMPLDQIVAEDRLREIPGVGAAIADIGAKSSSVRLLVQIPGGAAKMSRAAFTRAMGSMPSFRSLMYAYVQAFLEQVLVSVACNGAHSLKQRLARWLLMMRDRCDDDAMQITQNLLAEMLGVQRPTITNAARELERAGLIARGRRQVSILDRQGLVAESCECYLLVRARVASHLPKTYT